MSIPFHRNRVSFRPVSEQDDDFLFYVYATAREDELALTGWDATQKELFLKMQFIAQKQSYGAEYPDAEHNLIVLDTSTPIGRIVLKRSDVEFRLVDITILPEHRNKGIGTGLIREFVDEANVCRVPVRLHVLKHNRAISLYSRLGFKQIEDSGTHYFKERRPSSAP